MSYSKKSSMKPRYMDHALSPYTSSVNPCSGGESVKVSYILKNGTNDTQSFSQLMEYSLMNLLTSYLNAELTRLYGPTGDLEGINLQIRPCTRSERLLHLESLKKRCKKKTGTVSKASLGKGR